MPQPSVNKWAVPLKSTKKSISLDSSSSDYGDRNNSNCSNNNNDEPEIKKYDPCVAFISGTPLSNTSRNSRSSSISSSGNTTPLRSSGKVSPERKLSTKTFDPCVSFTAGKPNVGSGSDIQEEPKSVGVPPIKLENALRRAQNKKGYSVGTRLAPKPIQGVSKPGAVNNIAGLFGGANTDNSNESKANSTSRKQSATCVLRDDFQIKSVINKSKSVDLNDDCDISSESKLSSQDIPKLPGKDFTSLNQKIDKKKSGSRKFSSSTSQITLIESQAVSPEDGVFAVVSPTTWKDDLQKDYLSSRHLDKRKCSLSSSVENSEDEDSHVDSSEENELNNWKGRRKSYLAAAAKVEKGGVSLDATVEADDEDSDVNVNIIRASPKSVKVGDASNSIIIKEGPLNRKHAHANDRRRPISRTWRPIYAVLKGHRLFCYKEGGSDAGDDEIVQPIPIRSSIIEIASDYLKRKNVFRIVTSHGNEYLFQAENAASMMDWVTALRGANPDKESLNKTTASIKQEQCATAGHSPPAAKSPQTKEKTKVSLIKKGTSGFTILKGGLHSTPRSHQGSQEEPPPPGKTFGSLLNSVPMSEQVKNVPVVLYNCCTIIEEKGLNQTGLYRVPGNAAAWNSLKEELDTKDPGEINWDDEKWHELNNICSLVKTFLRELEDPIIPNNMYSKFIQANRIKDSSERLKTIKQLIWRLPECHFESIDFLSHHLKNLADNCSKNSMTERNIALILAPNIVRTSEVTTMVQDMSDQYQIVELLIRQCDWIFDNSEDCLSLPEEVETSSENIIASSMKDNLMESLHNQQLIKSDYDSGSKKENKFSSLKSNLSMRLRNNRNISPRTPKKAKTSPAGSIDNPSQEEEESDGNDTSESINTSPILETKTKTNFFKSSKEIMQNTNVGVNLVPLNKTASASSKVGSFQPNADITIQIKPRSPDVSPQLSGSDDLRNERSRKLSEKTLNRLNQLSATRPDEFKNQGKDDGSDSGITRLGKLDSDENTSGGNSDGGYQNSRKASLDSLSGPSPSIIRRYNLAKKLSNSVDVGDERTGNTLVVRATNDATGVSHENVIESDKPSCVIKRTSRRPNLTISPRVSKRELCKIMPGDDSFEEKVRALIDPEYSGELKEVAHSEMNQPSTEPKPEAAPKKTFAPISLSLNMNDTSTGPNAEWWLSDNRSASRKLTRVPKDKSIAANIISNAIDFRKQTDEKKNINVDSDVSVSNKNDLSNPSMTQRIGAPQKLLFNPEWSGRVNQFNQQKEECERKVTDVLGPKADDYVDPSAIKSKSDQIQYYLEKVTRLLNDSDGLDKEVILKYFQSKVNVAEPDSSVSRDGNNVNVCLSNSDATQQTSNQINSRTNERTAPLLDSTYSILDYNKFYAL